MQKNVSDPERVLSVLAGGLLVAQAMRKHSSVPTLRLTAPLGLGLLWRGMTGHCLVYSGLGVDGASTGLERQDKVKLKPRGDAKPSVLINKPLPEVRELLSQGSIGTLKIAPLGNDGRFSLELAGQRLSLELKPAHGGNCTAITAFALEDQHASVLGKMVSAARGTGAHHAASAELRKIKALLETGVVATIEGQTHGERSMAGKLVEGFMATVHKGVTKLSEEKGDSTQELASPGLVSAAPATSAESSSSAPSSSARSSVPPVAVAPSIAAGKPAVLGLHTEARA